MPPPRASSFAAALALASLGGAAAQWDTLCAGQSGGPYSAWNETRCDSATSTCCPSGFNPSGVGCCPFPNAVCCPGSQFACCPAGSTCTLAEGSGYDARYNCTAPSGAVSINKATCKGGPPLPMSATLKNVSPVRPMPEPALSKPTARQLTSRGMNLCRCSGSATPFRSA